MNTRFMQGTALAAIGVAAAGVSLIDSGPARASANVLASTWPARGNLLSQRALTDSAEQQWDHDRGAHADVRVLYAGEDQTVGNVVVLSGRTPSGARRLAFLSGPAGYEDRDSSGDLVLRAETADQAAAAVGAFDEERGDDGSRLAFGLAAPGGAITSFQSSSFDAYAEHPERARTALVGVLPAGATPANTTLDVDNGSTPASVARSTASGDALLGDASIGYLPSGARQTGETRKVSFGPFDGLQQRYAAGERTLQLTVVDRASLADVVGAAGFATSPANAHGPVPMTAVAGDGRSGFAWADHGKTYVVTIDGDDGWATVTAYHVALAVGS